jgi:hypothetical protein
LFVLWNHVFVFKVWSFRLYVASRPQIIYPVDHVYSPGRCYRPSYLLPLLERLCWRHLP